MLKLRSEKLEVTSDKKGERQSWAATLSWDNCEDDHFSIDEDDHLCLIAFGLSEDEALSNLGEKLRGLIRDVLDIVQLDEGNLAGTLKFIPEELELDVTNDEQGNGQSWEVRVNWDNREGGYSLLTAFGTSKEEALLNLEKKFRGMIRAVIEIDQLEKGDLTGIPALVPREALFVVQEGIE